MSNEIELFALKTLQLLHDESKQKFINKIQVTRPEIIKAFDLSTYNSIKPRLKVIRQNGRGSKVYFKTSDVLKQVELSYH